jgi:hypothetical protein
MPRKNGTGSMKDAVKKGGLKTGFGMGAISKTVKKAKLASGIKKAAVKRMGKEGILSDASPTFKQKKQSWGMKF